MDKKIAAATVVANPSQTAWSQGYIAGNFFAAISLAYTGPADLAHEQNVAALGKEIINTLEAEYFTIETKSLAAIHQAIAIAIKQVLEKENIILSASFASIVDNVLYVFALGGAKIYMKRGGKLGLLLASEESNTIASASGFLEDNDTIILQTKQFGNSIPVEKVKHAVSYNTPMDIAEQLSPFVLEEQHVGTAAVIFSYERDLSSHSGTPRGIFDLSRIDSRAFVATPPQNDNEENFAKSPSGPGLFQTVLRFVGTIASSINHLPGKLIPAQSMNRRKKMFLTLAIILACVLIGSVFFVLQKTQAAKNDALFEKVYTDAKKKYDDGQSLATLNKNLARDDFSAAQKTLLGNIKAFENDKPHQEKLNTLQKNVEDALAIVSGVNKVDAQAVSQDQTTLLVTAIKYNPLAISQDDKNVYGINQTAIFTVDKKTQKKTDIIENKSSWENPGGIGTFLGNIYVLDKSAGQIYKFVGSNRLDYLIGDTQDFSKIQSIAIDGSIWVLFSDGNMHKWTRGKADSFTVSGIDTPLKNPTRIFTDADIDNVYVLDNGNSRIVVLNKNGEYKTQYQNSILKTAKEFDILEKDKKIFVLSSGKIWQINL